MKVVILGSAHPLRGGLAEFNERLAKAYMDRGDEVEIVTFSLQYPSLLFPGKTQYSDDPAPKDLNIHVWVNSINPFNWIAVGRRIKKMKPDLIICKFWLPFMGPCFGTILRIARRNPNTKVVSIIDNIIPHEKRPFDRTFTKYFVNSVDEFIVMSRSVQEDMNIFVDASRVQYIAHPIYDSYGPLIEMDEARQRLLLEEGIRYILFFGFIRKYKGLDLAIKAMADPRLKDLNVKLIVAGEYYTDEKPYTDLIAQLQLEDQIILKTSFIPKSMVGAYFGASHLVVQPYKTATQSGISQMAYHFEKPMVVTRVGGLPEIVPDGVAGYVVDQSPEQISQAIVDYFEQDKEMELAQGVQKMKHLYSWDTMLEGIDSICR